MPMPKSNKKTDARRAAENKYARANLVTLACKIRKPDADRFRAICAEQGTTVNAMLTEYVRSVLDAHCL